MLGLGEGVLLGEGLGVTFGAVEAVVVFGLVLGGVVGPIGLGDNN